MIKTQVKFVDLTRQYESIKEDIDIRVKEVLLSGRYIGGERVKEFEREFSDYIGVRYGFGVGSGSDALIIALESLGIGRGDKVVTVPFTFVSTADAIFRVGATPVFVDIDPHTFTMDPDRLRSVMSPEIKAIIPVHLYGSPAKMAEIMEMAEESGVPVVEDAAQAHGAKVNSHKVGSIGKVSCFSFYPAKNLGAAGDAGFIATSDPDLAEKIPLLREYGQREKYRHELLGHNSRLDPLQAVILSLKLRYLEGWNAARRRIASMYRNMLSDSDFIRFQHIPSDSSSVYHILSIMTKDRDGLQAHLRRQGIETGIHYPVPIHHQKYYKDAYQADNKGLHNSETAALSELSLPMFPELTLDEVKYVAESIQGYFRQK